MTTVPKRTGPGMDAWFALKPFINGGLAGVGSTVVIQPIDIVKVRLQIAGGGSPFALASALVKKDGFGALYAGLSAGVLRQITYTSSRLGIFKCARPPRVVPRLSLRSAPPAPAVVGRAGGGGRRHAAPRHGGSPLCSPQHVDGEAEGLQRGQAHPPLAEGAGWCASRAPAPAPPAAAPSQPPACPLAGLTAGGLGALVGSPADLSLIRMQSDGLLPPDKRRNYKSVFSALSTIIKEEGLMGLFTGAGPTAVRAMALNMGMLASNDQAKEILAANGITGAPNLFGASAIAGFFAPFFSLPFDYVKTQLQKMTPLPDGTMPSKGAIDCAAKTFAAGGPTKFYTGFPTFYVRIAPHAMMTLSARPCLPQLPAPPLTPLTVLQDTFATMQTKNGF